jgi:tetratricopeptide (TPR) repeat protein
MRRATNLLPFVLVLIAISAAVWIAFAPGLNNEWLNWDDDRNFVENESWRGVGPEQLSWAWSTYHMGVWQPFAWMLLGLQYKLFGLDPQGFRIVSLALHALNCTLLYAVMLTIIRRTSPEHPPRRTQLTCGAIALLFAVHPLRVEAVNWISCQPYLPAIAFFLLGVLAYLKGAEPSGRINRAWLAAAWLCYCAAVMFKAVAVTLPIVLLILDWYPLRRIGGPQGWSAARTTRVLIEKIPFFLVAILISIWAAQAKAFNESRLPIEQYELRAILAQGAYGYCFYLWKTLWPSGLHAYYRLPDGLSIAAWPYWAMAAAFIATTLTCWLMRRGRPGLFAAWLAYLIILLPNVGIIQFSAQIAADRYAYLATMPLVFLLAAACLHLKRAALATSALAGATCLVALFAGSRQDVTNWRDSVTLWQKVLSVDDRCAVAAANMGHAMLSREDFANAEPALENAVRLDPSLSIAYVNLGVCHYYSGHVDEAISDLSRALSANPPLAIADQGKAHATLGACYAAQRKDDLAWKHALKAKDLGYGKAQQLMDYLSKFSRPPNN